MNKISGIYKITNIITGEFYIGSSKDIKQRWYSHKNPAFHKRHLNLKIYQDMNKYGLDKFSFEILEETVNLREREQYWFDKLKPTYNCRRAYRCDINKIKSYYDDLYNRLCQFEGKVLKFSALAKRFQRKGILHPSQEAAKYLLSNSN